MAMSDAFYQSEIRRLQRELQSTQARLDEAESQNKALREVVEKNLEAMQIIVAELNCGVSIEKNDDDHMMLDENIKDCEAALTKLKELGDG